MQKITSATLLALTLSQAPVSLFAAECNISSGKQITPLIELYTSEGCSSCPPADHWLSGLNAAGDAAKQVNAIALHVDYWDYIGWKDRFAQANFTARQRNAANLTGSSFVYTPQVLLNGKDFRRWQSEEQVQQSISAINKQVADVQLSLEKIAIDQDKLSAQISASSANPSTQRNADLFIVLTENQLKSVVNAGENSGRELSHDHVVRVLLGPYPVNATNLNLNIRLPQNVMRKNSNLVMFAQNRTNNQILQSVSTPLANCQP